MRIRTIKPEFFMHEAMAAQKPLDRILFVGLLCAADVEGRLEDRPARLKAQILPYDDWDVDTGLSNLARGSFIVRYTAEVGGQPTRLIQVVNFRKHQRISGKEAEGKSVYPPHIGGEADPSEPNTTSDHAGGYQAPVEEKQDGPEAAPPTAVDGSNRESHGKQRGSTREADGNAGREGKGEKLLGPPKEKKSAAVLPLGPFLPLQQQKPKATATEARTEAAPSLCDEDYSTSLREVTPILDAWEAKFAAAIAPEPVIACFNGDRHAAESLAEAVKFADDGELDRFIAFAKGSAKPFVTKSIRSVHFFATNAGTLLADLRATEAAVRAKVGEQQPKQKPAPKEADYLEALRRGSTENSALDSVGVMRQHFAAVLESWRKDAYFRASERKASAEGARVREKLQAENLERRKALDTPRVSDAGMPVAAPTAQPSRRKPLTPDQHAQRLAQLGAQKGRSA